MDGGRVDDDALQIEDLSVTYHDRERSVRAADGVTLRLKRGTTLALVGESGCGKTTVALAALKLIPSSGSTESGRVLFEGRDLLTLKGEELRRIRGSAISMIFQDPVSGLNPVLSIGEQVQEIVRAHRAASKKEARQLAVRALEDQGLSQPERVMESYPFQLSGGMCQRVMIAIATILRPRVIIADEPTSALDVTVQAAILRELNDLKRDLGASILLITHDLGVVAQMADDVAVMYAGRVVEETDAATLFARPSHPYTAALMAARPRLDNDRHPLQVIRGAPPDLRALGGECAFLPRCPKVVNDCRDEPWPALRETAPGQRAACFNPMFQSEPAARATERR
jgi:oligopeptide/dipeptide ABC transporter ATP-binding protein